MIHGSVIAVDQGVPEHNRLVAARAQSPSTVSFLVSVILTIAPPLVLLGFGYAAGAGLAFWGVYAMFAGGFALRGRFLELGAYSVAVFPLVNLLRSFAFYNIVVPLLMILVVLVVARDLRGAVILLKSHGLALALFLMLGVYYAVSFVMTGAYEVNLRVFELTVTAILVLFLAARKELLSLALLGMVISAWGVGLAMLPHLDTTASMRLGLIVVENTPLGNPIQLGLPLAFGFLLASLDRGGWLGLHHSITERVGSLVVSAGLLALTASRAAWLVALAGVVTTLFFGRRGRAGLLAVVAVSAIGLGVALVSPYGEAIRKGAERTFGEEADTRKLSSGRSDQWAVAMYAFSLTPGTIIHGYGPGIGSEVYASVSKSMVGVEFEVGRKMTLHSLFMQVMVEAGLIGFLPLAIWLITVFVNLLRWTRRARLAMPLAAFVSFIVVASTTSGFDTVSGTMMGLALLGTRPPGKYPSQLGASDSHPTIRRQERVPV